MDTFKLVSNYRPTGDQPQAISKLVAGLRAGYSGQTLLGVTGSGKNIYHGQYHCADEPSYAGAGAQ